jgi:cytoskeletal protein CcmA (bactofilin family)
MNTKFRFRASALCHGLVLAAALSIQSLVAAEPKPASSNFTTTALEQIVNLCPASHRSGLFTKIRQHDRSGDQVVTGRTYTLRAGESSEGDVVVIHGHARIDGVVNGDLALIGSDADIRGTINGDMVAVASRARFDEGAVVNGDFSSQQSNTIKTFRSTAAVIISISCLPVQPPISVSGLPAPFSFCDQCLLIHSLVGSGPCWS